MKLGNKTKRPTTKSSEPSDLEFEESITEVTRPKKPVAKKAKTAKAAKEPPVIPKSRAVALRKIGSSILPGSPEEPDPHPDPINDETDSAGVKLLPGVDKRTLRRINTMFGQRSDKIIQLLETTDTDGAASLTTRTLIQTLVDILPVAERGVRRSKGTRGLMGLNQIISQIRELLHDIQSYKDRDALGNSIVDKHLRPAFLDMAMQMSNLMVEMDSNARTKMKDRDYDKFHDTAENLKSSLADYMRRQYEDLAKAIRASL